MGTRAVVSWSSGKDSMLSLYYARKFGVEIVGLLSTITRDYRRVTLHGIHESLVEAQAGSLGLELFKVYIPASPSNKEYERAMKEALARLKRRGVEAIVFGDIFLRDVREYREKMLRGTGVKPLFPIWGVDTRILSAVLLQLGVKAVIASVDPSVLDPSWVCTDYTLNFIESLPSAVDPCGERGEFHTFVYDSPLFRKPVSIERRGPVRRNGYYYCDLAGPTLPRA